MLRFLSHEATPQCQVSCVVVVRIGKIIKKRLWYRSFEPEWPLSRQTEVQHDDGHPLQTRRHGASHRNPGAPAAASEPLACCMCMCCSHFLISYITRQILCLSQKLPNRNLIKVHNHRRELSVFCPEVREPLIKSCVEQTGRPSSSFMSAFGCIRPFHRQSGRVVIREISSEFA